MNKKFKREALEYLSDLILFGVLTAILFQVITFTIQKLGI